MGLFWLLVYWDWLGLMDPWFTIFITVNQALAAGVSQVWVWYGWCGCGCVCGGGGARAARCCLGADVLLRCFVFSVRFFFCFVLLWFFWVVVVVGWFPPPPTRPPSSEGRRVASESQRCAADVKPPRAPPSPQVLFSMAVIELAKPGQEAGASRVRFRFKSRPSRLGGWRAVRSGRPVFLI